MRLISVLLVLILVNLCSAVPVDVYALAENDGSRQVLDQTSFQEILREVNGVFSQVAMEFDLRSFVVVSNHEWMVFDDKYEFLDVLDGCPSSNGIPIYVVESLVGADSGWTLENEGCCVEANAGYLVFAHEIGHMCGLEDIYASAQNVIAIENIEEVSVLDDEAMSSWQPMDWGRYPAGITQGELVNRMLMNGYVYLNATNGADITLGDVYGVRISSESVTNATSGVVSRPYVKGMAKVGFLLHGNRNPSRRVGGDEPR